jgi:hypothetical protein
LEVSPLRPTRRADLTTQGLTTKELVKQALCIEHAAGPL